jgi:phage shock protein A
MIDQSVSYWERTFATLRDQMAKIVAANAQLVRERDTAEKERFKYETCLMLISKGYPGAAGLAEAALTKEPKP